MLCLSCQRFSDIFFYICNATVKFNVSLCPGHKGHKLIQGSHRLEKYLNIQGCLVKSLKIQSAFKSTGKLLKGLEKSFNFTIGCRI